MPSAERFAATGFLKRMAVALGAFAMLAMASTSYAFTPANSPLLSSAAVTPNVMLLVDNSGSMNSIIWAAGFDPTVTRQNVYTCTGTGFLGNCTNGSQLAASDTNIQLSELPSNGCFNGYYAFASGSNFSTSSPGRQRRHPLFDGVPGVPGIAGQRLQPRLHWRHRHPQ
jgi:hypothetical protein